MQASTIAWLILISLPMQLLPETKARVPIGTKIEEFELQDDRGVAHKLSDWRDRKLVAVVFLSVNCPLAKLYSSRLAELSDRFAPLGVQFVGFDCHEQDSNAEIAQYKTTHHIEFPILRDGDPSLAERFGATRSPVVFVLDERRVVRYQGRIDDQYAPGVQRSKVTHPDMVSALEDLLAGQSVRNPVTEASGCLIDRRSKALSRKEVTYCRDIAPILQKRCIACHRQGQVAPFPLTTYEETAGWVQMIGEVVEKRRMPPWHADPRYGKFANDPSLTDQERQLILDWVRADGPEGDPAHLPTPVAFPTDWSIPEPDLVVSIPKPFTVPAQGIIEYQYFEVDPGFAEDKWIQAVEIRPGNRSVVHHALVFLKPPGYPVAVEQGVLGSVILGAAGPGVPPLRFPDGMAKRVPAGWRFLFVLHYTAVGSVQTDQTSMGLVFADAKKVQKEVATKLLVEEDICIPPHVPDHRIEKTFHCTDDLLLLALFPHMHLRGKSFRYEALFSDGTTEILLDVPRFDFGWQNRYVLAEPKRLPAGTALRAIAHYDNSKNNPANPDPKATVRAGLQSWDEMFNGYFEVVLADQNLTLPPPWSGTLLAAAQRLFRPALILVVLTGVFLLARRGRAFLAGFQR